MHKSVPFSLGVIAASLAIIAGTLVYDRVETAAHREAALQEYAETRARFQKALEETEAEMAAMKANAQGHPNKPSPDKCTAEMGRLSADLKAARSRADIYAPAPHIKEPEKLNDVQAILHRRLQEKAVEIRRELNVWQSACGVQRS